MNSKSERSPRPAASIIGALVAIVVIALGSLVASGQLPARWATTPGDAALGNASGAGITQATVTIVGMSFAPAQIEVPAGNALEVTVVNEGDMSHDIVFENGAHSSLLAPGQSETVDVGVIDHSSQAWCSVPGHRQMGMTLAINVTGAAESHSQMNHDDIVPMDDLIAEAKAGDPHPATLPPLGPEREHHYTFEVTEAGDLWTFNGTSPGPTLHGRVGDRFVITLENHGTMGHSIDFHAGEVSPDEPMRTIAPGESLVYEFQATRSGIWMYHCSTMPMSLHIANGMFGAVVIEPDGLEEVDAEFVLIQSEVNPDLMAFNGVPFQYDAHPLRVGTGERVRMWVLDVGPDASLAFHVVGAQFDTVWSEGEYSVFRGRSGNGLTPGQTGAQVLPLLAAQGGFVEFVPTEAGHYPFVNHIMTLAERGAHGTLEVVD